MHPINAPTIGIKAVTAIRTPISTAYGIRNIVMLITNMLPSIHASRHCPDRKLENVVSAICITSRIFLLVCSGISAYITFFNCLASVSF